MLKIKVEVIDPGQLTPRECEVLTLICLAAPDRLIARRLAISLSTVETHLQHIYLKLDVRADSINTRCAAITCAVAQGMVRIGSLPARVYKRRRDDAQVD